METEEQRQKMREERREAIVAAARRVFSEKGPHGATMDEIARTAKVSKGALYLHFESKEELLLAVQLETLERQVADLRAAARIGNTGLERTARLCVALARSALADLPSFQIGIGSLFSGSQLPQRGARADRYRELMAEQFQLIATAVTDGKRDGSIVTDVAVTQLVVHLWAGLIGVIGVHAHGAELLTRFPEELRSSANLGEEGLEVLFDFEHLVVAFTHSLLLSVASPESSALVAAPSSRRLGAILPNL